MILQTTNSRLALGSSLGSLALVMALGCSSGNKQTETKTDHKQPTTGELSLLAVGAEAPDFSAEAHDGTSIQMSALKGAPVVLYFYPKDMTSG